MADLIPQSFIDDLLAQTDIVALVQRYVPLKKAGSEFAACCPFHGEKTPSFYVSPRKQFFHCFGCGAHGTAIGFLMQYANLRFPEALVQLAEEAGLELPQAADAQADGQDSRIRNALKAAEAFFCAQLRHSAEAVNYLKDRAIDGRTARDFALGWAPPGPDALGSALRSQFDSEVLISAGLQVRRDDGRLQDRFRARVIFPIRDRRGQVLGFGGRLITPGEPKYLNSPETAVFHKGRIVYGLYEAMRVNPRLDELVVVEGYMDVVALAHAGFSRAVACMGTALTRQHLDLLFRQVNRLILCFDGDAAGRRAAERALEQTLPLLQGLRELKFLFLPDGEDPDSLVRNQGVERWQQCLHAALPLSDALLRLVADRHPAQGPEGRSQFAHSAMALVRSVVDPVFRDQLVQSIASYTGVAQTALVSLLPESSPGRRDGGISPSSVPGLSEPALVPAARPRASAPRATKSALAPGSTSALWGALFARMIQRPNLVWDRPELVQLAQQENLKGVAILRRLLARIAATPSLTPAQIIEGFRDEPGFAHIEMLAGYKIEEDAGICLQVAVDAARRLLEASQRQRILALTGKPDGLTAEDIQELRRLQRPSVSE